MRCGSQYRDGPPRLPAALRTGRVGSTAGRSAFVRGFGTTCPRRASFRWSPCDQHLTSPACGEDKRVGGLAGRFAPPPLAYRSRDARAASPPSVAPECCVRRPRGAFDVRRRSARRGWLNYGIRLPAIGVGYLVPMGRTMTVGARCPLTTRRDPALERYATQRSRSGFLTIRRRPPRSSRTPGVPLPGFATRSSRAHHALTVGAVALAARWAPCAQSSATDVAAASDVAVALDGLPRRADAIARRFPAVTITAVPSRWRTHVVPRARAFFCRAIAQLPAVRERLPAEYEAGPRRCGRPRA
jgi:hypothetical protein